MKPARFPADLRRGARLRAIGAMLTVGAASVVTGCIPYEAQIQREVQRGEVRVRIESAEATPRKAAQIRLVVQNVPPGVVLLGAAVSDSPDAPCGRRSSGAMEGDRPPQSERATQKERRKFRAALPAVIAYI